MKRANLHLDFEQAFREHVGKVFSRAQIGEILRSMFSDFPDGSVVPTDHAELSPAHVNQCRKCSDPKYQIFDTIVEGQGIRERARYRVRNFEPYPHD
jgi:hypothetical protein